MRSNGQIEYLEVPGADHIDHSPEWFKENIIDKYLDDREEIHQTSGAQIATSWVNGWLQILISGFDEFINGSLFSADL